MVITKRYPHGPAALLAAAACALLLLGGAACRGGDQPPVRSPLGSESATAVTATGTVASAPTPSPSPGAPVTATLSPGGTPGAVDRELAIGMAIERMAQWLGVEQTALVFASFAEETFSDACLGIERPGVACAEVISPGVRVVLLDRTGASHEVRADASLQSFAWAAEASATGTVGAIDHSAGTLTVEAGGTMLLLRRAPGTVQDTAFDDLRADDEVSVGFDRSPVEDQRDVLVWIGG